MRSILEGVREDFVDERALLRHFEGGMSRGRAAFLLSSPRRPVLWIPQLLFHTLLLFMFYVIAVRIFEGEWQLADTIAIVAAGALAALLRLLVSR